MLLKFIATAILVLSSAVDLADAQGRCKSIAVRKEIRDLSSNERRAFLRAMRKVGEGRRPNVYNQLAKVHVLNQNVIHGYPVFLIWHRTFARFLEEAMLKVDPSVALHYWDWTKDAKHPERSNILASTSYFGGSTKGECLDTPNFPRWQAYNPTPHCLARYYANGNTPGPFYPRAITDEIRHQSRTYDYYRIRLEGGPHAAPHNGCGGDLGSMQSPEDPIFYVHHSFVDKLYDEWQRDDWSRRRKMYNGVNYDGSRAHPGDSLTGLGYTVGQCLDIANLCYRYQQTGSPRDKGRVNDLPMLLAIPPEEAARRQREQQRQQSRNRLVRRGAYGTMAAPENSYDGKKPEVSPKPSRGMEHPRSAAPAHGNKSGGKPGHDNDNDRKPRGKPGHGHDSDEDCDDDDKGHSKGKPSHGHDNDNDHKPSGKPGHGHGNDNDEDCDDDEGDHKPAKKVKHVVKMPKHESRPKNVMAKKPKPAYVAKVAPAKQVMVERPVHVTPKKVHKKAPKPKPVHREFTLDHDMPEYVPEDMPEPTPEEKAEYDAEDEYYKTPRKQRKAHPAAVQFKLKIPIDRISKHADNYDEEMFHPRPINEEWLKMNNIDLKTQRKLEGSYCGIIDNVNVVIKDRCGDEKKY